MNEHSLAWARASMFQCIQNISSGTSHTDLSARWPLRDTCEFNGIPFPLLFLLLLLLLSHKPRSPCPPSQRLPVTTCQSSEVHTNTRHFRNFICRKDRRFSPKKIQSGTRQPPLLSWTFFLGSGESHRTKLLGKETEHHLDSGKDPPRNSPASRPSTHDVEIKEFARVVIFIFLKALGENQREEKFSSMSSYVTFQKIATMKSFRVLDDNIMLRLNETNTHAEAACSNFFNELVAAYVKRDASIKFCLEVKKVIPLPPK